jgi:hypothetical protein
MVPNLSAGRLRSSVSNMGSETIFLLSLILRETDKRNPSTRHCWMESKKRLEKAKGRWVKELPSILWTYRTTPRSSTGETPFLLTYGVEAVILLEIGLPTIRIEYFDPVANEISLATDLDLAEEKRDLALIHLAAYQNGLRKMYEKRVNPRELAVGDLVLRKVMGSRQDSTHGKLGPNWEGPYKITSVASIGAFRLEGPNGTPVKRPWNICNLKKYYQ